LKSRLIILFCAVVLLWTLLIARAFDLQFLTQSKLTNLQDKQFQTVVTLQARRGAFIDRKGRDLALSSRVVSIYADPKLIEAPKSAAKKIAKELGLTTDSVYAKIKDKHRRFVWIQRFLPTESAEKIKSLAIRGLSFVDEWKRTYPNDHLLSQTLGFVGNEGQGLEGLENQYDSDLKGNKKKVTVKRDARGRPLIAEGLLFTENPDGNDIQLTIDSELQYSLESELKRAVEEQSAHSAVGVILDAETSAIRAMGSWPTFDPNSWNKVAADLKRNKAVTDAFEPGSTMKSFVVAAALKKKILQPNTKYFCENGQFKIGKRIIREADAKHSFGFLTVSEILAHSSNIGSTKIAFQLGDEELRRSLIDFGFGDRMGVDLPGEAKGSVQALPWADHLLSNISFGHGISASALQMANGYAALVNGGVLRAPYLVEAIRDPETAEVKKMKAQVVRRVLTEEESEKMRLMLMSVTNDGGTGVSARVNGFLVGGKTGTAQKVNPTGRGYLPGAYVSSFAGFIPAHKPKFVIYVAVDSPKKSYYGSEVAAPVFSRLASYAVRQEGLAPMIMGNNNLLFKDDDVFRKAQSDVVAASKSRKYSSRPVSLKTKSNDQNQAAESSVVTGAPIANSDGVNSDGTGITLQVPTQETVPNLKSLSLREVVRRLQGQDIQLQVHGEGRVSGTLPSEGQSFGPDKKLIIYLKE